MASSSAWLRDERPAAAWWQRERSEPAPPEDSPLPFWGMMAFTFVLLIAPQKIFPVLAPLRPALLAATLAVVVLLVHRAVRRQPLSVLPRELWLALCLAVWVIITLPLSLWPGGSVTFLLEVYIKSLAIFWLLPNAVNTESRLRRLAWALTILAIPVALTAVKNFLSGVYMSGARVTRILGYDAPLTQNPNDQALMLNLLLPLAIGLLLSRPAPLWRLVLVGAIALDVTGVIVTFSRAGFITLVAIAIAYIWKLRRRPERRVIFAGLLIGLLCLPLLPAGYKQRLATVLNTSADTTGSAQARRSDTIAAMRWVADNPIIGAGLFQDTLALNMERGATWKMVHNVYLEYAVDLGVPGLVLFLLLLGSCFASTAAVERRARSDPALGGLFHMAGAIRISLIAFSVGALFHPVAYHFYFYYIAGLAVALTVASQDASRRVVGQTSAGRGSDPDE